MMIGRELIASGRVQGVGFRWFVQDCATQYNIKGYVKNLTDGTVLIVAIGYDDDLLQFIEKVSQGNRHSQVRNLTVNELTHFTEYEEFIIV